MVVAGKVRAKTSLSLSKATNWNTKNEVYIDSIQEKVLDKFGEDGVSFKAVFKDMPIIGEVTFTFSMSSSMGGHSRLINSHNYGTSIYFTSEDFDYSGSDSGLEMELLSDADFNRFIRINVEKLIERVNDLTKDITHISNENNIKYVSDKLYVEAGNGELLDIDVIKSSNNESKLVPFHIYVSSINYNEDVELHAFA